MYPHERSLVKDLEDKPFAIIGINSDTDKHLLRKRIDDEQITWRSFWCGLGGTWSEVPGQWGIRFWPTIYLIDHKGVIRYEGIRDEELDEAIHKLIAEADADGGTR